MSDLDSVRESAQLLTLSLIEGEATQQIGQPLTSEPTLAQRHGLVADATHEDWRPGAQIPKLRDGSSSPRCSIGADASTGLGRVGIASPG